MTARDVVKLIIKILRYAISQCEKEIQEDDLARIASQSMCDRKEEIHSD